MAKHSSRSQAGRLHWQKQRGRVKLPVYSQRYSEDEYQIRELRDGRHRFSSPEFCNLLGNLGIVILDNTYEGEMVVAGVHAEPGAAGD